MAGATAFMKSPLGWIRIRASAKGIREVHLLNNPENPGDNRFSPPILECISQLEEYFRGERTVFHVPLDLEGTPFRLSVWEELLRIPFGETLSYGELAKRIGNPGASRAVGGANHHNPVAIIVPCHRVVGSDGSLVGYGSGLDKKSWLLRHERSVLERGGTIPAPMV